MAGVDVSLTQGSKAGCITYSANAVGDDTVVIGDQTYTYKASPSSANQVDVGTDEDTSIENLVAAINGGAGEGSAYATGTVQNEYVTASADVANDEIDLTARYPGNWVNGLHLAATGTGPSAAAASFGAVSGGEDGAGRLEEYISGLLELSEVPSDLYSELAAVTEEGVGKY